MGHKLPSNPTPSTSSDGKKVPGSRVTVKQFWASPLQGYTTMREPLHPSTDLNGIPVYDSEEIPLGATFGVLTEADSGLVRFFDISLEGRGRHVLIPVGHARVEPHLGGLRLRLRAVTAPELDRIPAYEPHVAWNEDEYQNDLLDAFGRLFEGQRYYAHPAFDHTGLYAGTHPLLKDSLAPFAPSGLRRLSAEAGFRVAEGEADIRGWEVSGPDHERIAVVTDLIIDGEAQQVRYVTVRRRTDDLEVVLPIGYVDLGKDDVVNTPLNAEDLNALPAFDGETLERVDEVTMRTALDGVLRGAKRYRRADFRSAA